MHQEARARTDPQTHTHTHTHTDTRRLLHTALLSLRAILRTSQDHFQFSRATLANVLSTSHHTYIYIYDHAYKTQTLRAFTQSHRHVTPRTDQTGANSVIRQALQCGDKGGSRRPFVPGGRGCRRRKTDRARQVKRTQRTDEAGRQREHDGKRDGRKGERERRQNMVGNVLVGHAVFDCRSIRSFFTQEEF